MRCIAYDRRGHGRSDDPGRGYDHDTLADDLGALLDTLELRDVCLVTHSMAGGEALRYMSRHGPGRIARLVLVAPGSPRFLAAPDNPTGIDASVFESVREVWRRDFGGWLEEGADAYFAQSVPENAISHELVAWTIRDMERVSLQAAFDCNRAMLDADWREEMRSVSVQTLLVHGDLDASHPIDLTSRLVVELIPGARLEEYKNAGHGLYLTHHERLNGDLIAFASAEATLPAG
jgi:pimeloyl-ACP methyl ester carboxylesterase